MAQSQQSYKVTENFQILKNLVQFFTESKSVCVSRRLRFDAHCGTSRPHGKETFNDPAKTTVRFIKSLPRVGPFAHNFRHWTTRNEIHSRGQGLAACNLGKQPSFALEPVPQSCVRHCLKQVDKGQSGSSLIQQLADAFVDTFFLAVESDDETGYDGQSPGIYCD